MGSLFFILIIIRDSTLAIIKIREESGGLEEALKDLCNKLQENIMKNINKCLSLIQPVIIAIVMN